MAYTCKPEFDTNILRAQDGALHSRLTRKIRLERPSLPPTPISANDFGLERHSPLLPLSCTARPLVQACPSPLPSVHQQLYDVRDPGIYASPSSPTQLSGLQMSGMYTKASDPSSQVFLASKAALTLGNKSTAPPSDASLRPASVLSHFESSSCAAVGRFVGSIVRQDRTNSRAVSETPAQYSFYDLSCQPRCGDAFLSTHWLKFVVPVANRLHLFVLRIPIEWRVATKEEVSECQLGLRSR